MFLAKNNPSLFLSFISIRFFYERFDVLILRKQPFESLGGESIVTGSAVVLPGKHIKLNGATGL